MNCVCIVCYLLFYKDYFADTRVSYIFLLHKKTPALPFGRRESLNKL